MRTTTKVPPRESSSTTSHNGHPDREMADVARLMLGDASSKASDYANYFVSYAYLYHQKQMLTDGARMRAYRDAILGNRRLFEGKTVLDVGAGSGILSIWAAKAGAKKVIAAEFTSMAAHAKTLVRHNGYADVIEVRQCAVEALDLRPGSVDVIISEWMGYFLLRESMLDSVLYARDHFLDPKDGSIFPDAATLYWAPAALTEDRDEKVREKEDAMADFDAFVDELSSEHGVDASCLRAPYDAEQSDYYLKPAQWVQCAEDQILGPPSVVAKFDLYSVSIDDVRGVTAAPFTVRLPPSSSSEAQQDGSSSPSEEPPPPPSADKFMSAFVGWFDVDFKRGANGRVALERPIVLSTAPEHGYTHWGQQAFFLPERHAWPWKTTHAGSAKKPDEDGAASVLRGELTLTRQASAPRLYHVRARLEDAAHRTCVFDWDLS